MEWMVLALARGGVAPSPVDAATALFSLGASLVLTAGVAWLASRVTRERNRRSLADLAAATPVAGVH